MTNMNKDIPYIEKLPNDWEMIQNRYLFKETKDKVGKEFKKYQLLSLTTKGIRRKDINAVGGKVPDSYENYQKVKKGQMVFCLFDLDCSAVFSGFSNLDGMITSAYNVYDSTKLLTNEFANYWFQYVFSNRYYKMYSKSIRYTITGDMFKSIKTPVPPMSKQVSISNFLDEKCSQIDKLVSIQEKQIENLKAYKQSLITETVTKGLNPDAEMKDSGIEWIGQINKKYNTVPINSLFTIKKNIIGKDPECVLSITQQGLKIKDISQNNGQMAQSYEKYQIVNKGDFAMNHMDLLTGWVDISKYDGVTSPDYRVFTLKDKNMERKYFLYVFQSYYKNKVFYGFGQGVSNMGRWRLPAVNFNKITIPVPPIEEQEKIVNYLDLKCNQIDKLIEIKQQKIEKLNEYKKSLIYECVTSKKEIN